MATLNLPNFLIIGAGKSGTTSLDNYLKQHPEIFIPSIKEPNFFGYEMFDEKDFRGKSILKHYQNSVTNLADYERLFAEAQPGQMKGETSNTYMYHETAADRIKHYVPDVKLIAILRQPTERLYSRYLHLARENRLPTDNFEDCLNKETIWWQRNDLVKEGFYYKYLSKYYELFPRDQIRVFLYDDFKKKSEQVFNDIFLFLGVDENFSPDTSVNFNKSGYIKNRTYNRVLGQDGLVKRMTSTILPTSIYYKVKNSLTVQRYLNKIRNANLERPQLDPQLKKSITESIYSQDITNLATLLNRDLRHWL